MPSTGLLRTRGEKKLKAREAVLAALKKMNGSVKVTGLESDLHDDLGHTIRRYKLAPCSLDRVDIHRAIRWLHAKNIVRVRHYGPEYERTHSVSLL